MIELFVVLYVYVLYVYSIPLFASYGRKVDLSPQLFLRSVSHVSFVYKHYVLMNIYVILTS